MLNCHYFQQQPPSEVFLFLVFLLLFFFFAFTPVRIVNTSVITGVNCRYAILLITANWLVSDFSLDCINFPGSEQLFFLFMNHVHIIPEEL